MTDDEQTIEWLRMLAEKGGKGVVNNIDARCLGRVADALAAKEAELAAANAEIERLTAIPKCDPNHCTFGNASWAATMTENLKMREAIDKALDFFSDDAPWSAEVLLRAALSAGSTMKIEPKELLKQMSDAAKRAAKMPSWLTRQKSWYCDRCAVEVYRLRCPHCGKTKREHR